MTRISFTIVILLFVLFSVGQINANKDSVPSKEHFIKVTLLGTGTPQPIMERFGPSILVQAGNEILLFDAGRGCLQRLRQLQLSYDTIDALFFTHLHSDHIVGLPDLWLTGWAITKRNNPLPVFGPKGSKQMTDYLKKAYAFDIKIRIEDDKAPMEGSKLLTTDIKEGVVYEKNGVRVIAFLVDHYPIVPAFGYRIEYGGHSVILSGDTRYSENLIKFAKGTDLLVHEVIIVPDTLRKPRGGYHHTTPEEASQVFNIVKPKLAVYSHIVRFYGATIEELIRRTKVNYSDSLVIGEDLMNFSVGETITIRAWKEK